MYLKSFDDMKRTSVFFLLKPEKAIFIFIITLSVLFVSILFWTFFAPMDDVVKATVLLRPSTAVSSVKCVTSGQIYSKNFSNDDEVIEGDLLFSLDTTVYKTELDVYQKDLLKNQDDIFINELLLETIENGEKTQLDENLDVSLKSNSYITEYQRYQNIIIDIKTKLEREANKPQSLKIPQNIIDLKNQLDQNELIFNSWKNAQKIIALDTRKSLQSTKNSIESRIAELERIIKNSTIYAPISGRISEVTKLNIGDYLLSGEEVLRIIPQSNERLKADIYVDPNYVARVKVGNPIKIKFPGLSPSSYGMIESQVQIIPPDVTYLNGIPVFIVEAEIESPYLFSRNGQSAKLIPGITAEGRIVTDKNTVLQMVMRKLDFIN